MAHTCLSRAASVVVAVLSLLVLASRSAHAAVIVCDGVPNDIIDLPGGAQCCGAAAYYPLFQKCCAGSIQNGDPSFQCCGTATYDPTTSGCCGTTVFTTSTHQCCGGTEVKTLCSGSGGAVSDPYIYAFGGGGFHFTGAAGKVFNLLSDAHLQVNCEFVNIPTAQNPNATYLGTVGVLVGAKPTRVILAPGRRVYVNEQLVYERGHLANSAASSSNATDVFEFATDDMVLVAYPNDRVRLRVAHYELSFTMFTLRNDLSWVSFLRPGFLSASRAEGSSESGDNHRHRRRWERRQLPHGIIGQTADGKPRHTAVVDGVQLKQGEGNIEGEWTDYVVRDGIMGVDFAFNRFQRKLRPVSESVAGAVPDEDAPDFDGAAAPRAEAESEDAPVSFSTGKRLLQAKANSAVVYAAFTVHAH